MSYYQFAAPSDWANYRNIDDTVNIEDLNQFNVDDMDDENEDGAAKPAEGQETDKNK